MLEKLQELNPDLWIQDIHSDDFLEYGKDLISYDPSSLISYALKHRSEYGENGYIRSDKAYEDFSLVKQIQNDVYGELEIQAGPCFGTNQVLNGVEYHHGYEVIIAIQDCVLVLGKKKDIQNNTYDTSLMKGFYMRRGELCFLTSETLHYTPCQCQDTGFFTIVMLLKGTNDVIVKKNGLCTKKNKWFMTHASQTEKVKQGIIPGLSSIITVHYKK